MTTTEVARALGIGYRRVHAWAARGYIDGLSCNGSGTALQWEPDHDTQAAFIADTLKSCAPAADRGARRLRSGARRTTLR
jgi:hypothetical protein